MAAVLVEGRAGVNVTFPALRTPRGRLMKSLLVEYELILVVTTIVDPL